MTAAARSTRTATKTARKAAAPAPVAPTDRRVRLLARLPDRNAGALRIEQDGEAAAYFFAEVRADAGRAFVLERIDPETCRVAATYRVTLADEDEGGCHCTCRGHLFRGRCKHVPALGALLNANKLS